MIRKPYPNQNGTINLGFTYKEKELWDSERARLEKRIIKISQDLGVLNGQQFLVCVIGMACHSQAYSGKGNPWYGITFPQSGYMFGGCKINNGTSLPEGLSNLRVTSNFMLGGQSLLDRLTEEITSTTLVQDRLAGATFEESSEQEIADEELITFPTNDFDLDLETPEKLSSNLAGLVRQQKLEKTTAKNPFELV